LRYNKSGDISIARRPLAAQPAKKPKGPRINRDITNPKVLLITETGEKKGVVSLDSLDEALAAARTAGLDLVEVAPGETPVCKVLDYGKLRFENQKKKAPIGKTNARQRSKKSRCGRTSIRMITK